MADNKEKKGFFGLFNFNRDGLGISKTASEDDKGGGFKRFFVTFKNNFDKLIYVNIFFVLGNFPIIFLIAALSGATQGESTLPLHDVFQNLIPFFNSEPNGAFAMTLFTLFGMQNPVLVPTPLTYVFYGIGALTLLTFGLVNVGTAYILRNIAMGEPIFTWSDFWYAIKRNWKQALPFGIVDGLIHILLIFNVYDFINREQSWFVSTVMWVNIVILVLYFFMRPYIYVQMVTFELSIYKMLKNALIFTLVGLKRNLLALVGIVILVGFEILCLFGLGGILLPIAVAAPLCLLFSAFAYMKVYAAYFKIKEVMIDPYYAEHPEEREEFSEDDIIMHDEVTERERIAEIRERNGLPPENYDEE